MAGRLRTWLLAGFNCLRSFGLVHYRETTPPCRILELQQALLETLKAQKRLPRLPRSFIHCGRQISCQPEADTQQAEPLQTGHLGHEGLSGSTSLALTAS